MDTHQLALRTFPESSTAVQELWRERELPFGGTKIRIVTSPLLPANCWLLLPADVTLADVSLKQLLALASRALPSATGPGAGGKYSN